MLPFMLLHFYVAQNRNAWGMEWQHLVSRGVWVLSIGHWRKRSIGLFSPLIPILYLQALAPQYSRWKLLMQRKSAHWRYSLLSKNSFQYHNDSCKISLDIMTTSLAVIICPWVPCHFLLDSFLHDMSSGPLELSCSPGVLSSIGLWKFICTASVPKFPPNQSLSQPSWTPRTFSEYLIY